VSFYPLRAIKCYEIWALNEYIERGLSDGFLFPFFFFLQFLFQVTISQNKFAALLQAKFLA
jgi:hypothetical protein